MSWRSSFFGTNKFWRRKGMRMTEYNLLWQKGMEELREVDVDLEGSLIALMNAQKYQVPAGKLGRVATIAAKAALLARLPIARAQSDSFPESSDWAFLMFISLVAMLGALFGFMVSQVCSRMRTKLHASTQTVCLEPPTITLPSDPRDDRAAEADKADDAQIEQTLGTSASMQLRRRDVHREIPHTPARPQTFRSQEPRAPPSPQRITSSRTCRHKSQDLVRTGRGAEFILMCTRCNFVIVRGESGCQHLAVRHDGSNQYGPRLRCNACSQLLLQNLKVNQRFELE